MKTKVSYEVYERWYDKYAANNEMKTEKLDKKAFMELYYDARYAKQDMQDFSRNVAMRQRVASELQVRTTWAAVKEQRKEFAKNIKKRRRELRIEELKEEIRKEKGKRRIKKSELEREVRIRLKKGLSDELKQRAEEALSVELKNQIQFVEQYKNLTLREFRLHQKKITNIARAATEDREIWDEAFSIAYDSPKESRVL